MDKIVIRTVWQVIRILLVAYAGIVAIGYFLQHNFVWPMSVEEAVDRPVPPSARLVWMGEGDNAVEGWFYAAANASPDEPAPALMFFHGNNEVIDHCLEFAETYTKYGISVLLVEYRGFGRSGGALNQTSIRSDMTGFYDWLVKQPGVDASRIIFHGRSIGGGVASDLANVRQPAAMILTSTFTSMESMFWHFGVPGFVVKDKYRPEAVVARANYPVLVMHGIRDNIIPISQGRELGRLGSQTRYIEYDANHDLPQDWPQFERDLILFLRDSGLVDG